MNGAVVRRVCGGAGAECEGGAEMTKWRILPNLVVYPRDLAGDVEYQVYRIIDPHKEDCNENREYDGGLIANKAKAQKRVDELNTKEKRSERRQPL